MAILLLILGLVGLWLSTESTLRGAVSIAQSFGLSDFIVGVAILSIGSDIPELAIAIDGAIKNLNNGQFSDVIIGSALGSSLAQIGLVLGLTGVFAYLTLPREITYQHGGIMLGSLIILGLFGFDGKLTRVEGIALIVVYVLYLIFVFSDRSRSDQDDSITGTYSFSKSLLLLLVGLIGVFVSAELTIAGVMQVASVLNINESIIAIVVVGLGTSLPELSISLGAVVKGKTRMSVGNLIGSNVFDTLIPIGVAAVISPLTFKSSFIRSDLPVLFFLSVIVLSFFIRKKGIQKIEAFTILFIYFTYVLFKLMTI